MYHRFYGRPNKPTIKTVSKHATSPFGGFCRLGPYSGLRKLARAMRRGLVPEYRQFTILQAKQLNEAFPEIYANSTRR